MIYLRKNEVSYVVEYHDGTPWFKNLGMTRIVCPANGMNSLSFPLDFIFLSRITIAGRDIAIRDSEKCNISVSDHLKALLTNINFRSLNALSHGFKLIYNCSDESSNLLPKWRAKYKDIAEMDRCIGKHELASMVKNTVSILYSMNKNL